MLNSFQRLWNVSSLWKVACSIEFPSLYVAVLALDLRQWISDCMSNVSPRVGPMTHGQTWGTWIRSTSRCCHSSPSRLSRTQRARVHDACRPTNSSTSVSSFDRSFALYRIACWSCLPHFKIITIFCFRINYILNYLFLIRGASPHVDRLIGDKGVTNFTVFLLHLYFLLGSL